MTDLLAQIIAARRYFQERLTVNDDADTVDYPALLKRSEVTHLVALLMTVEAKLIRNEK